jgi:hypothetical protein
VAALGSQQEDLSIMVPTLSGRIQTRLFVLAVIGSLLTLIVTPLLPMPGSLASDYRTTFTVLAAVAVLGVGWEFIYHGLQQFRWEKDWPTFFGLLTAINEGALVFALARLGALPLVAPIPLGLFLIDFLVVWLGSWLFVNGPIRVPLIRWRFHGGRVI